MFIPSVQRPVMRCATSDSRWGTSSRTAPAAQTENASLWKHTNNYNKCNSTDIFYNNRKQGLSACMCVCLYQRCRSIPQRWKSVRSLWEGWRRPSWRGSRRCVRCWPDGATSPGTYTQTEKTHVLVLPLISESTLTFSVFWNYKSISWINL